MEFSRSKLARRYGPLLIGFWLVVMFNPLLSPGELALAAEVRQSQLWLNASAAEFGGWQRQGTQVAGDALKLDSTQLREGSDPYGAGRFAGGNYYNGGSYFYGEAVAPYYSPVGGFDNAIVSWNALTPAGTWVEVRVRALVGSGWTREYVMGVWSSENDTVKRHSVNGQSDGDGKVDTDTLTLKSRASTFQVRAILFTTNRNVSPELSLAAVSAVRNGPNPTFAPNRSLWGSELAVPERSQMIYPDGGEVWCSPTSASMALAYWATTANRPGLNQTVPSAASRTFDWIYDGNGNWPFNTAYAGAVAGGNFEAYVTRLTSLSQVERWIASGVPVIVSIAYGPGQLDGTPLRQSNGHLLVIRGFDRAGNVITNDPAGDPRLGQQVRIIYNRAQFEQRWLASSGGAAYIMHPRGWPVALIDDNLLGEPAVLPAWALPASERVKFFADASIRQTWVGADLSVANGTNRRSWLWGPGVLTTPRLESYDEGPGGSRLVQYFDKSRMEITRPQATRNSKWFVTNGLLTVELVTGQVQLGDNRYEARQPANIPVAGDSSSPDAPTYATFRSLASVEGKQNERRAPNRVGQALTATLDRSGQSGSLAASGVTVAHYENTLGHNVPNVFWSWMNDPARSGLTEGWLFALGYPITEPYWVTVNLSGQPTTVLVQLFERRALTYAPNNSAAFQVEMGNIGQHYLAWRS